MIEPKELVSAVGKGNLAKARRLLKENPHLTDGETLRYCLYDAAEADNVEMIKMLIEHGADINCKDIDGPEGPIRRAAGAGAYNAVKFLLEKGAVLNHVVRGDMRCFTLTNAVRTGKLELVKLLVEHGAAINAVWVDQNSLSMAEMYNKHEIAEYLRSKGAVLPKMLKAPEPPPKKQSSVDELSAHCEKHFGKLRKLSVRNIISDGSDILVHVCEGPDANILVTSGMSNAAMKVPKGREQYQFAELTLSLPKSWSLDAKALKNEALSWPIEWIRRIARYPSENKTWLPTPCTIFANGEPPAAFATNTKLSCMLVLKMPDEPGRLKLSSGKEIVFYSMHPIYSEERDLERQKSVEELLKRFESRKISMSVDVARQNCAKG